MDFVLIQFLTGLSNASALFLIASGLTVIFGVTRIVNFAHGSFYMLGAYLAWTIVRAFWDWGGREPYLFVLGVLAAAVVVGLIGVAMEMTLLRRIYRAPELFQLLATFGVVLMIQDATLAIWGPEDLPLPRPPWLRAFIDIAGSRFPRYDLILAIIGPVVLALLWLLFHRTRFGILVRAATQDREMVAALGVDQKKLFSGVFFLGSALAGLGGALVLPSQSANLQMDLSIIAEAFVVVVVGGMGSVTGAFLASLLIAEVQAFGIVLLPKITLVLVFLVMAAVLMVRPYGLLGKPQAHARAASGAVEPTLRPAPNILGLAGLAALLIAASAPFWAGAYAITVLIELAVFVLFAASLHLMMGPGGVVSFGHAAYFGLGAYGAALGLRYLALPMEAGLVAAPLFAGFFGVVFGVFVVRLSGVYLAMLTLAFAQIVWAATFQWVDVTGGDNGILGVWPSAWAADKSVYLWLALALCIGGTLLLRRFVFSPFGYGLRAARDSELRAEAIGLDTARLRLAAFAIAAAAAGLAGGVYAYAKGSVFPTYISIPKSVDALLMVLLGGVQTVTGPIVGAIAYHGLFVGILQATAYWRAALGLAIVVLVLAFPQGIAGFARDRWERARGLEAA
ncbi:ABC transporter permease [Elioraea rosea]|uniref:ABC transporter permease n=1 Tax=Elioraea rosea TaxID=2492390 RepID=UPI001185FE6B|nr:ABC transporter permease [Elioraea rosea]